MKTALTLSAVLLLSGCAQLQQELIDNRKNASSGQIGCAPADIQISDGGKLTWTAICRGKVFYCTTGDGTSCKAAI